MRSFAVLRLTPYQFWKQFFEASANVSLSGYEELAAEQEDATAQDEGTAEHDNTDYTPRPDEQDQTTTTQENTSYPAQDESMLDDGDGDLTGSTPRAPASKSSRPQFAKLTSPYEDLKREMQGEDEHTIGDDSDIDILPHQHTTRLPDMSMSLRSSLGVDEVGKDDIFSTAHKNRDPLLHRVLDKNYRIQATPHKPTGVSPLKWKVMDKHQLDKGKLPAARADDSPMSSPEMAIPTLRSAAFMSPIKFPGGRPTPVAASGVPRTPGVSVQTPATAKKTKDVYANEGAATRGRQGDEITWDSDDDDDSDMYGGMSPPKTIQFALPVSKLLQTPGNFSSTLKQLTVQC